jgi:hypothetical protein
MSVVYFVGNFQRGSKSIRRKKRLVDKNYEDKALKVRALKDFQAD